MRFRFWAALLSLVLFPAFGLAQTAGQPAAPQPSTGYAPQPGMQFEGTLTQALSSKDAWVGEQIALINVNSTDQLISGARMYGRVVDVQHAGQGKNGEVLIRFDTLQLSNGTLYPVVGEVTHVEVKTKNNAAKEVLGTFGGMIVGNILGKWLGTNAGGLLGAAGGYLVAKNNRQDVSIPADSSVSVRIVAPHPQAPVAGPPPPPSPVAPPPQPPPPQPAATVPSYARPADSPAPPAAAPEPGPQQPGAPGPGPTPKPD